MKKILSLCLALFITLAMIPLGVSGSSEDEFFGIDRTFLRAGDVLSVNNPAGLELKYFVDGDEIVTPEPVLLSDYYEKWVTVRGYAGDELTEEDRVYFSPLPVIYINTEGGAAINSRDVYLNADLFIQGNEETSSVIYDGTLKIKGRGNSSWAWPKKSYRLKLDKKTDLFGMGKNKNWVLLSNYLDESALRNATGHLIAKEIGLDYEEFTWADVILNGEYVGNYLLMEQIRIDDTRVDIFDWENEAESIASAINKAEKKLGNTIDKSGLEDALKSDLSWVSTGTVTFGEVTYNIEDYYDYSDDISGGYLFELSEEFDEPSRFYTDYKLKVMVKSPEYLMTNQEMMDYVVSLWQNFEDAYLSEDGYADTASGRKHYTEMADFDSMVKYWLVNEIMGNNDASIKSRFAYIDQGQKLVFGPVWDFDWGAGTFKVTDYALGWKLSKFDLEKYPGREGVFIFQQFLDDPLFLVRATELYWEIRPYVVTLIEDGGFIDQKRAYLYDSLFADHQIWNRSDFWPGANRARGFDLDTTVFKQYMNTRLAWLDKQFETDVKLLESTRTSYSAHPYYKSGSRIPIGVVNGEEDLVSEHAPADSAVRSGKDVILSVKTNDADTVSVNIYVNGIYMTSAAVGNEEGSVVIPSNLLYEEIGKKNVISVIGKNSSGESTCRNFTTVISTESVEPVSCDLLGKDHSFTYYQENGDGSWTSCCDFCNAVDTVFDTASAAGHNFGQWTAVSVSCVEEGSEKRVCSFCGMTETRTTAPAGHIITSSVVQPTCTETGYTLHSCSRCDYSYKDNYVPERGHLYNIESNKTPTDTEEGYIGHICSRCGDLRIDKVLPAGSLVPGDADGDGEISDWDAIQFERYLAGWNVTVNLACLDIDGDGEITDWDSIILDRYLAGWDVSL